MAGCRRALPIGRGAGRDGCRVPAVGEQIVERVGAIDRQQVRGVGLAEPAQAVVSLGACLLPQPWQLLVEVAVEGRAELVVDLRARIDDGSVPAPAWIDCTGKFQLHAVLDDSAHVAAHRIALARAQVLHLLDQMRKVEVDVRAGLGETAQRRRLALGPDIEVLVVQLLDAGRHGRFFRSEAYHIGAGHRKVRGKDLYSLPGARA